MQPILQTEDISTYEFEEFCEKWAFYFYERSVGGTNKYDYDELWVDFNRIEPRPYITYRYTTSLGTKVVFKISNDSAFYFSNYYEFKVSRSAVPNIL
jgi:hypothetical protein